MTGLVEVSKKEYLDSLDSFICQEYNFFSKKTAERLMQVYDTINALDDLGYDLHYFYDEDVGQYEIIPCETKCFYIDNLEGDVE